MRRPGQPSDDYYPGKYVSQSSQRSSSFTYAKSQQSIKESETQAFQAGAAVAFGLMGMAFAIKKHHPCVFGEHKWEWQLDDDVCRDCGLTGDQFDKTQM